MSKVRKAVIAAAGFGTRFLPQTKAMPKEMLPLVDKPVIQLIAEQLSEAGIEDIILVTGASKRSIEDHFDVPSKGLIEELRRGGESKAHWLDEVENIANLANFVYVRQKGSVGNARPVMNVRHLIGDEPFIYIYADDIIMPNRFPKMVQMFEELGGPILPCIRMTKDEEYKRYGVVGGEPVREGVVKMNTIVEKPGRDAAPSDLANVGGYVFTPEIFGYLEANEPQGESNDEFQIQPIISKMIADGKQFFAFELTGGKYYDTGNKLEYLKTVVDFALQRDDVGEDFRNFLREKLQ